MSTLVAERLFSSRAEAKHSSLFTLAITWSYSLKMPGIEKVFVAEREELEDGARVQSMRSRLSRCGVWWGSLN